MSAEPNKVIYSMVGVSKYASYTCPALANRFVRDAHDVVKPGQIVKVKVMDVDAKRQRISLTMRLDDAPGASSSRSGDARAGSNPAAARGPGGASKRAPRV
jgi:uncharacterized protein